MAMVREIILLCESCIFNLGKPVLVLVYAGLDIVRCESFTLMLNDDVFSLRRGGYSVKPGGELHIFPRLFIFFFFKSTSKTCYLNERGKMEKGC